MGYTTKPIRTRDNMGKIMDAFRLVSDIVCSTMGPGGRNVIVHSEGGMLMSTKDGVTVARYQNFEDRIDNLIAMMAIDASSKTVKEVGDGTTTTIQFMSSLYEHLTEGDVLRGMNLHKVRRGIDLALADARAWLEDNSEKVEDGGKLRYELLRDVAVVSSNGDEFIGRLVSGLVRDVGVNGMIEVRDSVSGSTYSDKSEGYVFGSLVLKGFMGTGVNVLEYVDPFVLIADVKISEYDQIREIIRVWRESGLDDSGNLRPLVLICGDIEGSALSTLVGNSGRLPVIAVKAPFFGSQRAAVLEDLRNLVGCRQVFNEITGNPLRRFGSGLEYSEEQEFGHASKVLVYRDKVVVVPVEGVDVSGLVDGLISQLDEEEKDGNRQFLKERISRLESGLGTIYVGADSEVELGYKRMVIDDTIRACFTAWRGGVLPGGGSAFLKLQAYLLQRLHGKEGVAVEFPAAHRKEMWHGYMSFIKALWGLMG